MCVTILIFIIKEKKIGIDEVKNVLENMGLEYKDQELSKLMESLPFDGKHLKY